MGRTIPWVAKCPPDVAVRIAELRSLELLVLQELGPCRFLVHDPRTPSRPCRVTIGDVQTCSCALPGGAGARRRANQQQQQQQPRPQLAAESATRAPVTRRSQSTTTSRRSTAAPANNGVTTLLCDHILFVMHRVFRLPSTNPLLWQLSLLEAEIEQLVASRGAAMLHRRGGVAPAASAADVEGATPVEQRPIGADDTCPVCCENLLPPQAGGGSQSTATTGNTTASVQTALVWCQRGCGNSVHLSCFRQYAAHHAGGTLNCPLCRVPWGAASTAAAHGGAVGGAGGHCSAVCGECRRGIADNHVRYKCAFCPTFTLCAGCFANPMLHPQHPFDRMATFRSAPEPATRPLPPPPPTQPSVADDGTVSISAAQALRVLEGTAGNHPAGSPNGRGNRATSGGSNGSNLPPELLALAGREITPEDYDLLLRLDQNVAPTRRHTLYAYEVRALPTYVVPAAAPTAAEAVGADSGDPTAVHSNPDNEVDSNAGVASNHEAPCACAICLDVPDPGSVLVELPACGHRFHRECAMQWLTQSRAACPIDNMEVAPPIHAVPDDLDFLARAAAVAEGIASNGGAASSSSVTPGIAAAVAARHPRPNVPTTTGSGSSGATRRPLQANRHASRIASQPPPTTAPVELGVVGVGGGGRAVASAASGVTAPPTHNNQGRRQPLVSGITQRLLDAAAARRAFETAAAPSLAVGTGSGGATAGGALVGALGHPSPPPARARAASSSAAAAPSGRRNGGATAAGAVRPSMLGPINSAVAGSPATATAPSPRQSASGAFAPPRVPELFVWSANPNSGGASGSGEGTVASAQRPPASSSSASGRIRPPRPLPPRQLPPMPPATAPAAPLAMRGGQSDAATGGRAGAWRRGGRPGGPLVSSSGAATPPPNAALEPLDLHVGRAPPLLPSALAQGAPPASRAPTGVGLGARSGAGGGEAATRPSAALQQQRLRRDRPRVLVDDAAGDAALMAPTVLGVASGTAGGNLGRHSALSGPFSFAGAVG